MDCLHINQKAHMACELNLIAKSERLLKVTDIYKVHRQSGNIAEIVLDRVVVTTGN